MTNHCPKIQGCKPSGCILKKFLFSTILPYAFRYRISAKVNQWIVYYPDFLAYGLSSHDQLLSLNQGLYTIWKYFKKFYISQQYFLMHSEWCKMKFLAKLTCEWYTTLIFRPIVYLIMTNHCIKTQGCTLSGGTGTLFYFPQNLAMHSEWS